MAIEKMKFVSIWGPMDKLNEALKACVDSGCCHPENTLELTSKAKGFSRVTDENPYQQDMSRLLDAMAIAKLDIKTTEIGPQLRSDAQMNEYISDLSGRLIKMREKKRAYKKELAQIEEAIDQLHHFEDMPVELNRVFSCEFIKVRFGRLPAASYAKLKEYDRNPYVMFFPYSNDSSFYWGMYVAPLQQGDEIDRIFATLFFERLRIPDSSGTPEAAVAQMKKFQNQICEQSKTVREEMEAYIQEEKDNIYEVYTQMKIQFDSFELRRYSARYNDIFIQMLWVPEGSSKKITRLLDKMDSIEYTLEEPDEIHSNPPIKLKNHSLVRPFEFYVDMFGLPNYKEIDPTIFVAITYIVFFGIMFADLGQGMALTLIAYLLYKKKGMKLGKLLIPCGISSSFFGIIFGSVFGFEHALDPVYYMFGFAEKPIEIMNEITNILMLSVALGMVMLLLAMCLNIYSSVKKKDYGNALFGANGATGIIVYGSVSVICVMIYLGITEIPILPIAFFLIGIPLILMFLKEPLEMKFFPKYHNGEIEGIGDFLMKSFFEIFEVILSYVTNTVSFMRVGAFVLVHAGMMIAFFSLAEMLGDIGGVIMIIVGNIVVIALEGLLVGVQALRLEYYELFSRFFEGDGRAYEPIKIKES